LKIFLGKVGFFIHLSRMSNATATARRIQSARAEGKTFTINYKVTLCFYGKNFPQYQTVEGELYGYRTKGAARAGLTKSLQHFKADGRVDERIKFFHE
jgi:hypothetical protein